MRRPNENGELSGGELSKPWQQKAIKMDVTKTKYKFETDNPSSGHYHKNQLYLETSQYYLVNLLRGDEGIFATKVRSYIFRLGSKVHSKLSHIFALFEFPIALLAERSNFISHFKRGSSTIAQYCK